MLSFYDVSDTLSFIKLKNGICTYKIELYIKRQEANNICISNIAPKLTPEPAVEEHVYNPSSQEMEAGGF